MGKYTNALPPLWHLPSRIARSDGCLEWGSTLTSYLLCGTYQVELPGRKGCLEWGSTVMPYLLCGTYQAELPEVKVASNEEVH
jgi:hypothetical protein